MKRKFLALLLVITSILCSVGCSKKTPTISDENTSSATIENNDETSTSDEQIKPSEIETTSKEVDIEPTEAETTSGKPDANVPSTETPTTEAPTTVAPTKPVIKEEPTTVQNIKPSEPATQHIHSYKPSITKPTCTENGYITYSCNCGDCYDEEYMDATGHTYSTVITKPTCTEQGYTTYTCDDCKHQYVDDYVNANGHTEVIDPAVAATYTSTGLTQGKHCSACNEILVAQKETPKSNFEPFYTDNILILFEEPEEDYFVWDKLLTADYQILEYSCKPNHECVYIDHLQETAEEHMVYFTVKIKVKCIATNAAKTIDVPYAIRNEAWEVISGEYDDFSLYNSSGFTKGRTYIIEDTIRLPAVRAQYAIQFLTP